MVKHLLRTLTLMVTFFVSVTAFADGIHVGYCDGVLATNDNGSVTGLTGNGATIQEAIFITPSMLSAYKSGELTSVYAGLAQGAADYPSEITVWVRSEKDGADLASGTKKAQGGWQTVKLNKAISVAEYADKGLWVGFSFVQEKKLNVIAFLTNSKGYENTGWICKNGKWSDYSSKQGILPIEAVLEGDQLPKRDLAIVKVEANPDIVKIGQNIKLTATIRNNATISATNPILKYSIADGKISGEKTINTTMTYRKEFTTSFTVPSSAITDECDVNAVFTLEWPSQQVDEYPADNSYSLPITFAKQVFYRKMLCEEATGAWCGWCVRGLVGLKRMREGFYDRFIGIGVHNGDDYVVSAYDTWMGGKISGYPSALINRDGNVYDPDYGELKAALDKMPATSEVGMNPTAELQDGKITFNCDLTFAKPVSNPAYKMLYVVVEDKLPINQSNYYSGGSYGAMGGFENLGSKAQVDVDDVARGVFPSATGVSVSLPASIEKGSVQTHTLTGNMPKYTDLNNTYIVAVLLDSKGQVVNAERGPIAGGSTGVDPIKMATDPSELVIYNMSGQRLSAPQKGINIINGKKYIIK